MRLGPEYAISADRIVAQAKNLLDVLENKLRLTSMFPYTYALQALLTIYLVSGDEENARKWGRVYAVKHLATYGFYDKLASGAEDPKKSPLWLFRTRNTSGYFEISMHT